MSKELGEFTTADEVLEGVSLKGKNALITGVSAGLGVETARVLVKHGANVTGTARNIEKALKATASVTAEESTDAGSLKLAELDLANLDSVEACISSLINKKEKFDIVIANAGVMAAPQGKTADGFETQFGTNYVGHFVFINGIASLINDGGRVVILSSVAHHISDVDLNDLNFDHTDYDPWLAYGRSKTAVALFAVELDKQLRSRGIRVTTIHPGAIKTELTRHTNEADEQAVVDEINKANAAAGLPPLRYKTIPEGTATSVWAATVADSELVGGQYCEDCHVAGIDDSDGIHGGVRSYALDASRARDLWTKTEELLGRSFTH